MAFNIFKWILGNKGGETDAGGTGTEVKVGDFLDVDVGSISAGMEVYLERMAFWSCVRKIGAAVSAVEWETYRRGKSVKAREYWAWNYEPNQNENREQFFSHLIGQLFQHQEALVIETQGGGRFIADSFTIEKRLSGNQYRDIVVDGESVPGVYYSEDVIHLTISGDRIRQILTAIAATEGKLIKTAASSYIRGSGMRGTLRIEETAEATEDFDETYEDLINNKFKKFFTAENAVLPLFEGYDFTEQQHPGAGTKGTRDIRSLIDDVVELTAQAIGIPPSIAAGKDVKNEDFKEFMTVCVQPLVRMIAEEMNRKIYGRDLVFAGTYIVPNYAGVRYTDLFDVANPIDKLIGSGAFCINDIRMSLGLDVIDEPWAWQHWMTKNYSSVDDLLNSVDGDTTTTAEPPGKEREDKDGQGEEDINGSGE